MLSRQTLLIAERVEDLLSQMTLEEKTAQLCCCTLPDTLDDEALEKLFANGMGTVNYLNSALTGNHQKDIETLQRIQDYLLQNTRLRIPVLAHSEAIAGAQIPCATTFPQSLGMAATWQPDLARQMGSAVKNQLLSHGIHAAHSPLFDLGRDPRWGRIGETYGESPLLVAQMGTSFVKGLQGDMELMATAKHFISYGNSLGGRNGGQADMSERTLLDEYCLPFEAAIQEGGVMAVMNSYGTLNGEPTVSSRYLMTEFLRNKLGFDGPVVSDYGSVERTFNRFGTANSRMDAAIQALSAGIDVDRPDGICFHNLTEAVKTGLIEETLVDQAVRRILNVKFRLGLFENCRARGDFETLTENPQTQTLSQSIAEKSIVLAKNDGILPLKKDLSVAVIGPSADTVLNFFGGYSSVGTVNASNLDFNRSELDNFRKKMLEIHTTQHKEELFSSGIKWE
ncbi:beta-glucosidase-like glycosyl hydrolase [Ohessyouella blattaphilus]|uniref:glycoside hydrolase family 3 protein n=1 Tax=Ohessyouella blattaphilus TaxID=2949333 RepID=UPI003E1DECEA